VRVSLEIKPVMLPFFTAFKVNNEKHTLKPYMSPVNHNHLNEITWLKTVHTFMVNFCQESDDKNNTMSMEDMGRDACVILGCHKQVSNLMANLQLFSKWKNTFKMWSNL
jgi:hypothetical protein